MENSQGKQACSGICLSFRQILYRFINMLCLQFEKLNINGDTTFHNNA